MSILVVGGTGNIGAPLVNLLTKKGLNVSVATRDKGKNPFTGNNNVTLVEIKDIKNKEEIDAATKGATKIALIKPFEQGVIDFVKAYAHSAKRTGTVKHIVLLSAIGANDAPAMSEFQKNQRYCEKAVEESGIPYTHLRPVFFYQNLLNFAGGIKSGHFSDCTLNKPQIGIDTRDIASAFVTVLTTPGHEGKIYELAAEDDARGYVDHCVIIQEFIPQTIRFHNITVADHIKALKGYGIPQWNLDRLTELNNTIRAGFGAPPNTHHLKQLIGNDGITVRQFAEDHKKLFSA